MVRLVSLSPSYSPAERAWFKCASSIRDRTRSVEATAHEEYNDLAVDAARPWPTQLLQL